MFLNSWMILSGNLTPCFLGGAIVASVGFKAVKVRFLEVQAMDKAQSLLSGALVASSS